MRQLSLAFTGVHFSLSPCRSHGPGSGNLQQPCQTGNTSKPWKPSTGKSTQRSLERLHHMCGIPIGILKAAILQKPRFLSPSSSRFYPHLRRSPASEAIPIVRPHSSLSPSSHRPLYHHGRQGLLLRLLRARLTTTTICTLEIMLLWQTCQVFPAPSPCRALIRMTKWSRPCNAIMCHT